MAQEQPHYALDIGTTLLKTAIFHSAKNCIEFTLCPVNELEEVVREAAKRYFAVTVTGGGAFKYSALLHKHFTNVICIGEMECIHAGTCFLMRKKAADEASSFPPTIVANVGSGVSFVKTDGGAMFTRVWGSCVGGATFLGLARRVMGVVNASFDECIAFAAQGDASSADFTMEDVYGKEAAAFEEAIAAGETWRSIRTLTAAALADAATTQAQNVCAALLRMVCIDVASHAALLCALHGATRIAISGSFGGGGGAQTHAFIDEAVAHFGGGSLRLTHVPHAPFVCAMGALQKGVERCTSFGCLDSARLFVGPQKQPSQSVLSAHEAKIKMLPNVTSQINQ